MNEDVTLPLDDDETRGGPPRSPDAVVEPRTMWGSFRLLERVGYGGFGEVYRAWDPSLEREVALKLLLANGAGAAQSEDEYKAMLREARALASVRHPNIVSVYGIDRHDGRVGFWTDFVKGKTLSVLVGSQGPFGDREATLIGLDVARALSAVHRAGILHRDIKAENVMREEGGRILLMDFGLSALPVGQTNIAGTPNYMAPELWQGMPASVESDIYSMGCLLYFLVTGEYAAKLGGLTTKEITEAITKRRPLMDVRPDLPDLFLQTVSKAMESDPAKRFTSAGQLAAALSECLGMTPSAKRVASSFDAVKTQVRQRWLIPIVGAALVLGVVAFKTPAVRQWLHPESGSGGPPVAVGISASTNDQYLKARGLLKKSYKDANVAEAVGIFQQILNDNPGFALAESGLGYAYFTQYRNSRDEKQLALAKQATDDALSRQADMALALATRGLIQAKTGDPQLAKQDAEQATHSDPHSAEAFAALAEAYDALGRKQDAIDALQHAMDLDPDNSMLPVRMGNFYLSDGKLDEAAGQWQNAVKIDPENVFAYFDLGVVNVRLNKLAEAREDYQKVLKAGQDADSYSALGTVSLLEGKYDDAIEMDKKAIEFDQMNPQNWANLGSALIWKGGGHEEAMKAYRRAIELAEVQKMKTPDDAQLLADLADYYAEAGDAEKSPPLARKALVLSPTDPYVLYTTGDAYELLGQRAKAIDLIARALTKGFRTNEFERSPELAGLRGDLEFQNALKKAKEEAVVDSTKKMN